MVDRPLAFRWQEFFTEEEVREITARLQPEPPQDYSVQVVDRLENPPPYVGLDVETDTEGGLVGIGVAYSAVETYYIPYRGARVELPEAYVHNGKYDAGVLRRHGMVLNVRGDSRVLAYLSGYPEAGLKQLVLERYGYRMRTFKEVTGGRDIREVPQDVVAAYCCDDARWALTLCLDMERGLSERLREVYQLELDTIPILVDMEEEGIAVDRESVRKELERTERLLEGLKRGFSRMAERAGYGPDCHEVSPIGNDARKLLYDVLHLPITKLTDRLATAMDVKTLLRLSSAPEVRLILKYKDVLKYRGFLKQWYVLSGKDGKIHPEFTNTTVVSGRLSSRNPNVQQIRVAWRRFFLG